jgi:hypothetical protein
MHTYVDEDYSDDDDADNDKTLILILTQLIYCLYHDIYDIYIYT